MSAIMGNESKQAEHRCRSELVPTKKKTCSRAYPSRVAFPSCERVHKWRSSYIDVQLCICRLIT